MSEARLLALVVRYPHPRALARHAADAADAAVFPALRRVEASGLVRRRRGEYRLTTRGRNELAFTQAVARLVARSGFDASEGVV